MALVGRSGSGKSTMLSLLMGSLAPTSGDVVVGDRPLAGAVLDKHRRTLGIIVQGGGLASQLSVHQNVVAGLVPSWPMHRVLLSSVWPLERERVSRILARVGLKDRQWSATTDLSGGERMRVAVARALIDERPWVVADEPNASLDPANARAILDLLLDDAQQRKAGLVFSTHWVSLLDDRLDRIVGLKDGEVLWSRPGGALAADEIEQLYEGSDEIR